MQSICLQVRFYSEWHIPFTWLPHEVDGSWITALVQGWSLRHVSIAAPEADSQAFREDDLNRVSLSPKLLPGSELNRHVRQLCRSSLERIGLRSHGLSRKVGNAVLII